MALRFTCSHARGLCAVVQSAADKTAALPYLHLKYMQMLSELSDGARWMCSRHDLHIQLGYVCPLLALGYAADDDRADKG